MAYRRYSRSARGRSTYRGRRATSRRRTSRSRSRSGQTKIVLQVVGPAGGMVPMMGSTVASKGARPVRRRF